MLAFLQAIAYVFARKGGGFGYCQESVEEVHYILIGSGTDDVLGIETSGHFQAEALVDKQLGGNARFWGNGVL